jgi:hypothetical protein
VNLNLITLDLVGMLVGALLVLMIFSYLLGDNPLYRLALHLFVGVAVGYALGLALRVILSRFFAPLIYDRDLSLLVPLILVIFLLIKGLPKYAYIGNMSVAYLVGVGAAVALSGALLGGLVPQIGATGRALRAHGLLDGLIILVGTLATLAVFTFTVRGRGSAGRLWSGIVGGVAWVGRWFLITALALGFAGAFTAAASILIGRLGQLLALAERLAGLLGLAGG